MQLRGGAFEKIGPCARESNTGLKVDHIKRLAELDVAFGFEIEFPRLPPAIWGKRRGMHEMVEAFRRFEDRVARQAQEFMDENIDGR